MVILLLIMVSNTFVHYLSQAASGTISSSAVLNLISFTLPNFIVILIPITFFLAIVISFGKLFSDNELLVLLACGLSWKKIIKMGLRMAFFLAVSVGILSFWLVPKMLQHRDQLQASAQSNSAMTDLQTGRFILLNQGKQVVYVGSANKTNTEFGKLFMYEQGPKGEQKVTFAPHGTTLYDSQLQQQVLVLDTGNQYKLIPGRQDVQMISFDHYKVPVDYTSTSAQSQRMSSASTLSLIQEHSFQAMNELVWRLSQCVTVFVLLFLGLAICWVPPRKSRYIKLIPAVLIFIIYFNLLAVSHNWATTGWLPLIINVWGVHLLFLLISGAVLWKREHFL